jgi:hypothetical protein
MNEHRRKMSKALGEEQSERVMTAVELDISYTRERGGKEKKSVL